MKENDKSLLQAALSAQRQQYEWLLTDFSKDEGFVEDVEDSLREISKWERRLAEDENAEPRDWIARHQRMTSRYSIRVQEWLLSQKQDEPRASQLLRDWVLLFATTVRAASYAPPRADYQLLWEQWEYLLHSIESAMTKDISNRDDWVRLHSQLASFPVLSTLIKEDTSGLNDDVQKVCGRLNERLADGNPMKNKEAALNQVVVTPQSALEEFPLNDNVGSEYCDAKEEKSADEDYVPSESKTGAFLYDSNNMKSVAPLEDAKSKDVSQGRDQVIDELGTSSKQTHMVAPSVEEHVMHAFPIIPTLDNRVSTTKGDFVESFPDEMGMPTSVEKYSITTSHSTGSSGMKTYGDTDSTDKTPLEPDAIEPKPNHHSDAPKPTVKEVMPMKDRLVSRDPSDIRVGTRKEGQHLRHSSIGAGSLKGHTGEVRCCALLSGTEVVSGSDDKTGRVWSIVSGKTTATLRGHTQRVLGCCQVGSEYVLTCSADTTLRLWNGETTLAVFRGHKGAVRCCAALGNGRAVSGSDDGTLRVWNLEYCTTAMELKGGGGLFGSGKGHTDSVTCCSVVTNDRVLSGSKDATLRLWDLSNGGQVVRVFRGHKKSIYCCDVFDSGLKAVSGGVEGHLRLWNLSTGETLRILKVHSSSIECCFVLSSGNLILSGGKDGSLFVHSLSSGAKVRTLTGHENAVHACTAIDERHVLSCGMDMRVRVWDMQGGRADRKSTVSIHRTASVDPPAEGSGGVVGRHSPEKEKAPPSPLVHAKSDTSRSDQGGSQSSRESSSSSRINELPFKPDPRPLVSSRRKSSTSGTKPSGGGGTHTKRMSSSSSQQFYLDGTSQEYLPTSNHSEQDRRASKNEAKLSNDSKKLGSDKASTSSPRTGQQFRGDTSSSSRDPKGSSKAPSNAPVVVAAAAVLTCYEDSGLTFKMQGQSVCEERAAPVPKESKQQARVPKTPSRRPRTPVAPVPSRAKRQDEFGDESFRC